MSAVALHIGRRAGLDSRGMDIVYVGLILAVFALVGLMAIGVDRL
jgi:hypothetical protein